MRALPAVLAALLAIALCGCSQGALSSSAAAPRRAVVTWPPNNAQSMPTSVNSLPAGFTNRY